jgi:hypothetical protein
MEHKRPELRAVLIAVSDQASEADRWTRGLLDTLLSGLRCFYYMNKGGGNMRQVPHTCSSHTSVWPPKLVMHVRAQHPSRSPKAVLHPQLTHPSHQFTLTLQELAGLVKRLILRRVWRGLCSRHRRPDTRPVQCLASRCHCPPWKFHAC